MKSIIENRTEFIVKNLRETAPKFWREVVSRESGVPYKTILKIAYRVTKDPRGSTVEALFSYLSKNKQKAKT